MASTKIRVSSNYNVFHKVASANDMPEHLIGTNDSVVHSLGGTGEFEIDTDENTTYTAVNKIQGESSAKIDEVGNTPITKFLYIKNTGFQDQEKTVPTASDLGIGFAVANWNFGGFKICSGESVLLRPGSASSSTNSMYLTSLSGNIYVEVVFL
tara:strand:- start:1621 stop:2082 length:462 start_codon:yes stop_codon:yes gene_type:complete